MAKLNKLYCPSCQAEFGTIHIMKQKAYLVVGIGLMRDGIINCYVCRRPFYWHGEDFDKKYHSPLQALCIPG